MHFYYVEAKSTNPISAAARVKLDGLGGPETKVLVGMALQIETNKEVIGLMNTYNYTCTCMSSSSICTTIHPLPTAIYSIAQEWNFTDHNHFIINFPSRFPKLNQN